MQIITRDQLQQRLDRKSIRLVEVLESEHYDMFHLPGAINVPLDEDFEQEFEAAVPDKSEPVALYCMSRVCDAAPKAAHRLEEMGYTSVYGYEAGKMDWRGAGLPMETT